MSSSAIDEVFEQAVDSGAVPNVVAHAPAGEAHFEHHARRHDPPLCALLWRSRWRSRHPHAPCAVVPQSCCSLVSAGLVYRPACQPPHRASTASVRCR
jgi:hypothetical protein